MRLPREHQHRPVTLVWLDADEAILLRSGGPADEGTDPPPIRRVRSEVPPHHRTAAGAHPDRRASSGGGADPDDLAERRRERILAGFLREVASLVPPGDRVVVLGPGPVHGRFAADLRADDVRHRRDRPVEAEASPPLTDRQLRARVRELAGTTPERRLPANAGTR